MNEFSPTGNPIPAPQPADGGVRPPINGKQLGLITLAAIAVFATLRLLPTGTNLSHMDFRATGANSIEFCDPLNPQFISVVSARSPVTMAMAPATDTRGYEAGREIRATLTLKTGSGKPIAPEDLLVTHTKLLHLLIIDPSLTDYQHVHPVPGKTPGEWTFSFTPRLGGIYRVFADFTPVATGRSLYASADVDVGPALARSTSLGPRDDHGAAGAQSSRERPASGRQPDIVERDGFRFSLDATPQPLRAGQAMDLGFSIGRTDGSAVPLQTVMGAFAHLVAFDEARAGFAHLHPVEIDPLKPPDSIHPKLNFKLTIPQPGRYVIWAQVNLGGREMFVPFWIEVT